jgi:hypothetical protein
LNFSPAVQDGGFHGGSLWVPAGQRKKFPNQKGVWPVPRCGMS